MEIGSRFVALGAINALLAIAAGAFGAHALKTRLSERALEVFELASRYQLIHAVALVAIGALVGQGLRSTAATSAGWVMLAGIVVFCGSLYALALTNVKILGAITPIGGVAFLIGWGLLAWAALVRT